MLVIEAWFRLNHQPASPQVHEQYRERNLYSPRITLEAHFRDQIVGLYEGVNRLQRKLGDEARIWVQKPPVPLDVHRQNALDALDKLEAAIRQGGPDTPGPGHNRPPGPLDGKPVTLDDGRRETLAAVQESRQELLSERPNVEVLRRSAQRIIKLARTATGVMGRTARATWSAAKGPAVVAGGYILKDAYDNGPDVAIGHVTALAHKAGEAAIALQAFVSGL